MNTPASQKLFRESALAHYREGFTREVVPESIKPAIRKATLIACIFLIVVIVLGLWFPFPITINADGLVMNSNEMQVASSFSTLQSEHIGEGAPCELLFEGGDPITGSILSVRSTSGQASPTMLDIQTDPRLSINEFVGRKCSLKIYLPSETLWRLILD